MMKRILLWGVVALTMFAFMGCGDDDPGEQQQSTPDVLKLTVSSIPGDVTIYAASLLKDGMTKAHAVAAGTNTGGTISFYKLTFSDEGAPIMGAKYTTLGEYYIVLADYIPDLTTGEIPVTAKDYIYCTTTSIPGVGDVTMPAKFNFTNLEGNTLAWDKFVDSSLLGP
jgi:hypothetical protein